MKKRIKRLIEFLKNELWTVDLDNASKLKQVLINFTRIISLGLKGFKEDKLNVRASALTYFTLLSIVPVLALGFGIAKGFGLEAVLEDEVAKNLAGQEEAMNYILEFTHSMLGTAKGGLIAGLGFILLLWSVIKLLSNIENSFNTVWDIKKSRSVIRKFTDYLAIMLLGPVFLIMSSSITVFISSQLSSLQESTMFNFATPMFFKFAKFIPFVIIWFIFTLLYMVMPNTKVKFKSAFIAGIIAGTMFQIFQNLYVYFQAGATRINAIYGSFAALPLFLIWLQTSWFVVLLGAEISFVVQNVKLKGASMQLQKLSISYQKKIALLIVNQLVNYFKKGEKAPTSEHLSSKISVPVYTIDFVLHNLINAGIVSKITKDDIVAFQPAMGIDNIDLVKVINAYEHTGDDFSNYIKNKTYRILENKMKNIQDFQSNSEDNILLKDLKNE
ncbi:MAG: YihY/virulence factor BrkB family protein [Bacteroidales bacterium]|nr:YihY/virulence factor BrkB family protein [Bacteroidales bacterium]